MCKRIVNGFRFFFSGEVNIKATRFQFNNIITYDIQSKYYKKLFLSYYSSKPLIIIFFTGLLVTV